MDLPFLHMELNKNLEKVLEFQSLFLWIFRSYTGKEMTFVNGISEFQSLFLWIFRSYKVVDGEIGFAESVSILVLMDLPFLQRTTYDNKLVIIGFNPCSYGSSVLTMQEFKITSDESGFQSLFLWIFRSYSLPEWTLTGMELVSILVLMDLPFLQGFSMPKGCLYGSFNPCSYGSSILTLPS